MADSACPCDVLCVVKYAAAHVVSLAINRSEMRIDMNNNIFRKKSIERISSPEQLTDYIRVTNPAVWMVLGAAVILLVGVCVWGVFGRIDTKLMVAAESENGKVVCYVKESDIGAVKKDMPVVIENKEYRITGISAKPIAAGDDFEDYKLHVGNIRRGEWVYVIETDISLEDGIYPAEIITERVAPMSFVFN